MSGRTVLGFDYGSQWIGVASGQTVTGTATPLKALRARDGIPDWAEVERLLQEWRPAVVVVGLPLNMDGSPSDLSQRADKFGRRLHGRFGVEVVYWDERLSSFEARGEIMSRSHTRSFKQAGVDSLSARLILESWLRERGAEG